MADSDKNIRITTNKNKAIALPSIVFTGSSAGTSVLTLEVRDDNTVAITGTDGDVFSLDYNLTTGTIWSVNDKSGTPFLRASAGGTIGIAELGANVRVGIGQTNPQYKLDVQGWAGFASTGDGSYTILVENGSAVGSNALSIRAANALRFYNSGNTLYSDFKGAQSGVNTTYTLPATSPATGSSVLQSTAAGVLSWVPMVAGSPGGSGTVNSGTAGSVAIYAADGTAVSGTGLIQVPISGTAISVFTNLDLRSQNDIRFFNTDNSRFAALQASNVATNYTLSLPTAPVGAGTSLLITGSDSNMYFVAPGSGIAFSSATANTPLIRAKRALTMQFSSGYTPLAAGPDNVILRIPESAVDGLTDVTYRLRELDIRVETPSAGTSRIQLEKLSSTGAFVLGGTGYSMIGGFGITLTGAGTYFTSTNSFLAGSLVTSNDKLRINWTLLNATHANFSIQLTMEEV